MITEVKINLVCMPGNPNIHATLKKNQLAEVGHGTPKGHVPQFSPPPGASAMGRRREVGLEWDLSPGHPVFSLPCPLARLRIDCKEQFLEGILARFP
jgi:hypothetical protein